MARFRRLSPAWKRTNQRLMALRWVMPLDDTLETVDRLGPSEETLSDEKVERRLLECLIPTGEDLAKIMRYEAHLNRQLYQALHELEALKARRQGQAAPLARIDLQASAET